MPTILVETAPDPARLERLGVAHWPTWEKEVSQFPWTYAEQETCYLIAGRVIVTPAGGAPVEIAQGDLVTFPAGLACTWQVVAPLRKHYRFG